MKKARKQACEHFGFPPGTSHVQLIRPLFAELSRLGISDAEYRTLCAVLDAWRWSGPTWQRLRIRDLRPHLPQPLTADGSPSPNAARIIRRRIRSLETRRGSRPALVERRKADRLGGRPTYSLDPLLRVCLRLAKGQPLSLKGEQPVFTSHRGNTNVNTGSSRRRSKVNTGSSRRGAPAVHLQAPQEARTQNKMRERACEPDGTHTRAGEARTAEHDVADHELLAALRDARMFGWDRVSPGSGLARAEAELVARPETAAGAARAALRACGWRGTGTEPSAEEIAAHAASERVARRPTADLRPESRRELPPQLAGLSPAEYQAEINRRRNDMQAQIAAMQAAEKGAKP